MVARARRMRGLLLNARCWPSGGSASNDVMPTLCFGFGSVGGGGKAHSLLFPRGRGGPAKPRTLPETLDPRLRGGTGTGGGARLLQVPPPRRRPGSSWGTVVTQDGASLLRPFQLGPGLRRGGAVGDGLGGSGPLSVVKYPPFALSAVEGPAPCGVLRRRSARTSVGKAANTGLSSSPYPPARSSRSTASCRAVRCRSFRSDAPAPACAPLSVRAGPHGCRG